MLIVWICVTSLCSIPHYIILWVGISTNQGTTTRGSDHLVAIERENTELAKCTEHLTIVATTKALGSILYNWNIIAIGNLHNAVNLVWHTIESNRNDSLWSLTRLCDTILDSLFQKVWIHIPCISLRINEYRSCTKVCNRMRRRTERKWLHDNLIARTYATSEKGKMHSRSTRRECHDFLILTNELLEVILKSIHVWPERHYPVSVKCLFNIFLFKTSLTHVSKTKIDGFAFFNCHFLYVDFIMKFTYKARKFLSKK